MRERLLSTLTSQLVKIPSVNPDHGEGEMLRFVESGLRRETDAQLTTVELSPGRSSLAAVIEGGRPGPRLVLNGHMDTVGIGTRDLWRHDPFGGEISDGCVHGRGACDMKGGLAVAMWIARHFSAVRGELKGQLVVHFAAGEERGEPGTQSLIEAGFGGDFAIVLEPTELQTATAGRGLAFLEVILEGRSGHAGSPELALNPLDSLAAVMAAIDEYRAEMRGLSHPLLPSPSITPTMISAGTTPNAVPGSCRLTLDRRMIPGERIDLEVERLRARIEASLSAEIAVDVVAAPGSFEPAESQHHGVLAETIREASRSHGVSATAPCGVPYASDFSYLAAIADEAVVFGPGSISLAHAENERVPVADLVAAAGILEAVVERMMR